MILSTSQPTNTPRLPTEVIVKILASLDIQELLACFSTSRRLHAIISNSMALQYHIHLAASGLRDGPPSEVSTAERMAALQAYNKAWRELSWSSYDTIDIPSSGMPGFSDGLIVSFSDDKKSLTVHQLPSKLRRLDGRDWTLSFDFSIALFAMDASQDLLALVPAYSTPGPSQWCEPRILLRTLSNGQPHPLAMPSSGSGSRAAAIELQDNDDNGNLQAGMEYDMTNIHGDYFGTVVHGGPLDYLSIWNWKTGRQEWSMPLDKGISQWCFLDDSHVVFPKNISTMRHARHRRLHVCRFRNASNSGSRNERVFALPDSRWSSMGARLLSQPKSPSRANAPNNTDAYLSSVLFHPSAEDSLLTVELWAYENGFGWEVSDLHIPTRVLLSPPKPDGENGSSGVLVPWEVWSPAITQSRPLDHPRDMAPLGPVSHGLRRIAWDCGMQSRNRNTPGRRSRAVATRRKTISVYDLHMGRVHQAVRCSGAQAQAQELQSLSQTQFTFQHGLCSGAYLPREIQDADPVGLKFAMCGDALVVLEVRRRFFFFLWRS
ncbi:hypothetical protein B0F90DRAFT_1033799 [Multifurca ochricompacta]|uniref:F-box domain-containing protein n=1 Tax=Multifurca ochricompacta TaxID=376703 RepID=A0AAD4QK65_9AGAM|nr:hypothetical protein B0F90DRAFT_1033799 [Multifurca ochricompacta]